MNSREKLLHEIEAFLNRTGTPPARFGLDVLNDGRFVARLRQGKDVRLETADKVRAYMRDFKIASGKQRPKTRPQEAAA